MASPKKPPTITVTLTYPRTKRKYYCMFSGRVHTDGSPVYRRPGHQLKDGDHLYVCHLKRKKGQYNWSCVIQLCQDHWPDHEYEHTLEKLGGE